MNYGKINNRLASSCGNPFPSPQAEGDASSGPLRKKWQVMAGLIFIFIAGYLGCIVVRWGQQTGWGDLLIAKEEGRNRVIANVAA